MDSRFARILDAFRQVEQGPPTDLREFLMTRPSVGELPSPWQTWTLIGMVRHRERQNWVLDIIRDRLRGNAQELATLGALDHPEDIPQSGTVPGLIDWEYFFHGIGCCFTDKVQGDTIDVNFHDDTADFFDTYFYKNYLESLKYPEPPEERVRELHPSANAISIAIEDLLASGALVPLEGRDSHPYRLSDQVVNSTGVIDDFCTAWESPDQRLWLAALIGDWPAADQAGAEMPELDLLTAKSAESCRDLWWQRLYRELHDPYKGFVALQALVDLKAPDADIRLENALKGPLTGTILTALDVIDKTGDRRWCPHLFNLLSRTDPSGDLPQPHIWIRSLKFLLRQDYQKSKLVPQLARAGRTIFSEAVLLSLEHAPELSLPLIRKGLLSDVPIDRTGVSAILVLIGKPWSLRELLRALEVSDDQEKTGEARAALLETTNTEAHNAVLAWEKKNPHENEVPTYLEIGGRKHGPFLSMGEHALKDRVEYLRYEMEKLHDRVMQRREVVPPEPSIRSNPWWRFWEW